MSTTGRVLHSPLFYDALAWVFLRGRERAFRQRLLDLARLRAGETVLDVGCGTGTLAIAAKQRVGPTGSVHAIDASPQMIARATMKARARGADVDFRNAVVEALPYPDAHFDVVLSTLMLHHLPRPARRQCAREIGRVLKRGGRVLAVDFGMPQGKRRGLLSHFHRHGHVALGDMIAALGDAGLTVLESGAVGVKDLQFVLATNAAAGSHPDTTAPITAISANRHRPTALWIAAAVAAVIAAHGLIVAWGSSYVARTAAVATGVVILVILIHLGVLGSLHALVKRRFRRAPATRTPSR